MMGERGQGAGLEEGEGGGASFAIRPFDPADEQAVIDLIVPIQRDEFGIAISVEDQPDLRAIPSFYQTGRGLFLVAEAGGRVVGTVALKDIGSGQAALRKMFVAPAYRGRPHGTAGALLDSLLASARSSGIGTIWLGTIGTYLAAHRFYEKAGFHRVDPSTLPASFPRMAVDDRFYRLDLA